MSDSLGKAASESQQLLTGMTKQQVFNNRNTGLIRSALEGYADEKGLSSTDKVLNDVLSKSVLSRLDTAIGDNFYGINHRNLRASLPPDRTTRGLVFFTRPDLNLSTANLRVLRKFNQLRSDDPFSLGRVVRCTLDPDLQTPNRTKASHPDFDERDGHVQCPVVDPLQVFIPVMTNTCISVSGFEDIELPTYTTKPGPYGEAMAWADGHTDKLGVYDVTTTFQNMVGSPVMQLVYYWMLYAEAVRCKGMHPKWRNLKEHRIDYHTAIYRLLLDHSNTYVEGIARTGFSQPKYAPLGAMFNYEQDKPFNEANAQLSITWTGHGMFYQDDMIVRTFNSAVQLRNPLMRDDSRARNYVKMDRVEAAAFNYRGYPRIDYQSRELQWWIDPKLYEQLID